MLVRGTLETSGTSIPGAVQIRTGGPGLYLRAKVCHAGQHSPRFRTLLSRHVYLDEQWVTVVTAAQKAQWATYAAGNVWRKESGRIVSLNSYQVFIKTNIVRMGQSLPFTPSPPGGTIPTTARISSYEVTPAGVLQIQFDNTEAWTTDPLSMCTVIDLGPVSPGRRQTKSFAAVAARLPGITAVGYPNPILIPRPYPATTPPFALLRTYVTRHI